jgi:hypothetical protein
MKIINKIVLLASIIVWVSILCSFNRSVFWDTYYVWYINWVLQWIIFITYIIKWKQ